MTRQVLKLYGKQLLFAQHKRHLFTDQETLLSKKVLFIGNAGIYALHKFLDHAAINSIKNNITVVYKKPWFCESWIHSDHDTNQWGQTPNEFPHHVFEMIKKIFSTHSKDSPLNFKQIRELHKLAVTDIRKFIGNERFIEVEKDTGLKLVKSAKKFHLSLYDKSIIFDHNTVFYNWLRIPRMHEWPHAVHRNASEIYALPKNFFKLSEENSNKHQGVIIQGACVTIPWIIRDFPDVKIALIKRPEDNIQEIPRNKGINLKNIEIFILDENKKIIHRDEKEYGFTPVDEDGRIMYLHNEAENFTFTGHFYTCMGTKPDLKLTECVTGKKIELPLQGKGDKWVAPKNIPENSTTESFLLWMSKTQNIRNSYEPQFYHTQDFRTIFASRFKPGGVVEKTLNQFFYDKIGSYVSSIESPVDFDEFHQFFEGEFHTSLKDGLKPTLQEYTSGPIRGSSL